jgi:hypothetical protein
MLVTLKLFTKSIKSMNKTVGFTETKDDNQNTR